MQPSIQSDGPNMQITEVHPWEMSLLQGHSGSDIQCFYPNYISPAQGEADFPFPSTEEVEKIYFRLINFFHPNNEDAEGVTRWTLLLTNDRRVLEEIPVLVPSFIAFNLHKRIHLCSYEHLLEVIRLQEKPSDVGHYMFPRDLDGFFGSSFIMFTDIDSVPRYTDRYTYQMAGMMKRFWDNKNNRMCFTAFYREDPGPDKLERVYSTIKTTYGPRIEALFREQVFVHEHFNPEISRSGKVRI
jgi:hypothetical protein